MQRPIAPDTVAAASSPAAPPNALSAMSGSGLRPTPTALTVRNPFPGQVFLNEQVLERIRLANHRRRPGPAPRVIELVKPERVELERRIRSRTDPAESAFRARIILALADAPSISCAARTLNTSANTVRLWRDRFLHRGLEGLKSLPIPGKAPSISDVARVTLIGMACGQPSDFGVNHRNTWTTESLQETFIAEHPDLGSISPTSVQRILSQVDLKPYRLNLWLHSMDPEFRRKINAICALYRKAPKDSIVLCFDEKTGMQALGRKYPSKAPAPGRRGRQEFEYIRHGTRSLLATFNPHSGEVFAQVRKTRTADDLVEFMEALAIAHPTQDIHIVWDNLNIHHEGKDDRWTAFNARHNGRFHFHYTPFHASWVNQVELFFGIFSKRVLRYADFGSALALEQASLAFIADWNRHEKHPFAWKFKGYPLVVNP